MLNEKENSCETQPPQQQQQQQHKITHFDLFLNILKNLPHEIYSFNRIPCAMQSIYTGIIGGTLISAMAIVSTGRLSSLKHGVLGWTASSLISWHRCRYELNKNLHAQVQPVGSIEHRSDQSKID